MPEEPPSQSSAEHLTAASHMVRSKPVRCAILTVSDTRTADTDIGGPLVESLLSRFGHQCIARDIVRDEPDAIANRLRTWLGESGIDAILITGGTGISRRDTTIEVVRRLVTVELEGFGELFRMLSYEQVQGAAMLSRAVAGLCASPADSGKARTDTGTFVFAMPGSPNAIEIAMEKLIGPQLAHLVWERRR